MIILFSFAILQIETYGNKWNASEFAVIGKYFNYFLLSNETQTMSSYQMTDLK